jgi:hypothetical protein
VADDAALLTVINNGVNQSVPIIKVDTSSKFIQTVPEIINKDEVTGRYNIQTAESTTLV